MLKRFRIPALVLAVATVMTAMPVVSQARDRDDNRGRVAERHVNYRPVRSGLAFGTHAAPRGYFDRVGVWHAYGC